MRVQSMDLTNQLFAGISDKYEEHEIDGQSISIQYFTENVSLAETVGTSAETEARPLMQSAVRTCLQPTEDVAEISSCFTRQIEAIKKFKARGEAINESVDLMQFELSIFQ